MQRQKEAWSLVRRCVTKRKLRWSFEDQEEISPRDLPGVSQIFPVVGPRAADLSR